MLFFFDMPHLSYSMFYGDEAISFHYCGTGPRLRSSQPHYCGSLVHLRHCLRATDRLWFHLPCNSQEASAVAAQRVRLHLIPRRT